MTEEHTAEPATTEDIVDMIIKVVKERSHKLITKDSARAVYEAILLKAVHETKTHGYFRLPYGYGQFVMRVLGLLSKPRKLPSGEVVARTPKSVMRYQQGATVAALLTGKTPGAYKRRGPKSAKQLANLKGFAKGENQYTRRNAAVVQRNAWPG